MKTGVIPHKANELSPGITNIYTVSQEPQCARLSPVFQECNFVKFSRGHVGSLTEYFRSPQENLGAHNDIEFIFKSKNAETVKMQNANCPWIFLCNATRNFNFVNIFVVHIVN